MSGPLAGVVSASRPPGLSTRRISDRRSWTSRTCSIVSAHRTRSNAPSSSGSGSSGESSTTRACGSRRRARSSATGDTSARVSEPGVEERAQTPVAAPEVERTLGVAEPADELGERRGGGPRSSGTSSQSSSS